MTRKLRAARSATKSARIPNGNQNFPVGNQIASISPVMQKVKGSLPKPNSAEELAFLASGSLSTAQKLLSGHAVENGDWIRAMSRTRLCVDVVLGLTDGSSDPVARRLHKLAKRLKYELQIEALDAGDAE